MVSKEEVIEALKKVFDPEIPVNIVDLGLIYDIKVTNDKDVHVKMTLTAPGCPMHSIIANDARQKISEIEDIGEVSVEVVWDPPWSPDLMSEEAKQLLGFMQK